MIAHPNPYIVAHFRRTKRRPLSARQRFILEFARAQVLAGGEFPTDAEIAAAWGHGFHSLSDVRDCLGGIAARGLIEARAVRWGRVNRVVTRWIVTGEGWALP